MTKKDAQNVINEVRAVCAKHGVALVGTYEGEGFFGEITIFEASNPTAGGWQGLAERLTNEVDGHLRDSDEPPWMVTGIGDLREDG